MRQIFLIIMISVTLTLFGQTTLEQCQTAAEKNYPLIKQYDLIAATADMNVSNIMRGWLPQVSLNAQATLQSDVTAWPEEMKSMLNQMGVDVKGLKKDQYRIGVDINQTVVDGGAISSRKEIAREQANVDLAQNEVSLYGIRSRVNEMYFALLLVEDKILLCQDLQNLLENSEAKLKSLYMNGAAAESDYNSVKAERLDNAQQLQLLKSQENTLKRMLSLFCGIEVASVIKPSENVSMTNINRRPELRLFDSQLRLTDARKRELNSLLYPKVSVFAQGFYGYPGYNMFEDMMNHRWTLNGMIGVRMSWNIGALYTRNNDLSKLRLQRELIENNREVFLFNNNLEQVRLNDEMALYRSLIADDNEIIALRLSVRRSAESRLDHGIIDVNDLIKVYNQEHAARVAQSSHEIEMLKRIYNLKYVTNN